MHRLVHVLLLTAVAVAASAPAAAAQSAPGARKAAPARPRPSPRTARAVHDALHDSVQALLDRGVRDSVFPGAVAIIGRRGGPVATVTAGRLDWAASPAATTRTLWDLASLTKVVGMTSAMMQLVERGKVELDAPVQRYLPEWVGPNQERVTVRHLITHQSGLPAFKQHYKVNASPDSTLRLFLATPLDTLPGARMVYSDIGAILLGKVVERVSGERLDRYLDENVFEPLGMRETRFRPDSSLLPRIAPTERDPWRGRHLRGEVHDENAFALGGVSAHAGLFSTAQDLERFARALLNGGALEGRRFARATTIRQFTTVQDSSFSSRALGWDTPGRGSSGGRYMARPAFGHTGYTGTSLWIAPQHDLYVILLTNRVNPTRERTGIGAVRVAVADAAMRALAPAAVKAAEARAASASSPTPPRP